ncbi:hypothetical protein E2562_033422 [Oryza meyeriana var. granulata]|uniref:DNA-directed RNA polymerase subunit n=1 Tax=Oryza meyeriana var. granulata TaxID=110450 RepID=A0A6G1CW77_9ORYZ|nr:hypothetical protein E2562_033422 [Oryza meyeriana var. granulata]
MPSRLSLRGSFWTRSLRTSGCVSLSMTFAPLKVASSFQERVAPLINLVQVSFRLLMFRPFVGEVLVGKINGYDEKGLHVSLDFFSDICIPGHLMQYGTARALDGRWMLKTEDGDELYLDIDDEIRFLVSSIKYPPIPVEQKENDMPFAPMQIIGSIKGDGLGLLAWWAADE